MVSETTRHPGLGLRALEIREGRGRRWLALIARDAIGGDRAEPPGAGGIALRRITPDMREHETWKSGNERTPNCEVRLPCSLKKQYNHRNDIGTKQWRLDDRCRCTSMRQSTPLADKIRYLLAPRAFRKEDTKVERVGHGQGRLWRQRSHCL